LAQSPFSTAKFIWVFIAWWMVWSFLQTLLLYRQGFSWPISIADSIVFNFLTAAACLLLTFVMKFYFPQQERFWYILAVSISLSVAIVYLGKWILIKKSSADAIYIALLKKSLPIRFGVAFLQVGCMAMISVVWYSFQDQKEIEQRKSSAEALSKEAELIALRRQLQPHFLFNSLNSISALVAVKPQQARDMIHQLSDFLRGTIKNENDQIVSFAEEIKHLQLYLGIEKLRFGDRLNTVIEADEICNAMKLPALVLQPIVENAIKFGLYDTIDDVAITIIAKQENGYLVIAIQNPYDWETAQPLKGTGFGLSSVKRRLYLLFARQDLVEVNATEKLFTTTIKIPQ
jgi:sensor histidine kinase YesM